MLRLKGVTIFGETKEFYVDRVVAIDGADGKWWVEIGNKTYVLDPATIHPADDPRKAMLEEIREKLSCLEKSPIEIGVHTTESGVLLSELEMILDEMEAKL